MDGSTTQAVASTWTLLQNFVPSLIGAVLLLVAGWVVAKFAAKGVENTLKKSNLGIQVADAVADEDSEEPRNFERMIGHTVFLLIMLFVVVGFFQILGITQVTEPIIAFLNQIFVYAPRLIGPALLIVVAWLLAKFLRIIVGKAVRTSNLDKRLRIEADLPGSKKEPLANTLAEAVYWLTLLLFLPAVLSALDLGGLLEPVRDVVNELLGYLPNLLGAAVILVVGWVVARVLKRLVTNLLITAGADSVAEKAGISEFGGKQKLSDLAGLVVYVLVFIPVLVAALNALEIDAVTQPVSIMLSDVLSALPNIFAGVLVMIVAYLVGRIVAGLATNLLAGAGFDVLPTKIGLGDAKSLGTKSPSEIVGYLLFVAVMLFATIEALDLIGFASFADLVASLLVFASRIIFGIVVIGLGVFLGRVAADMVKSANPPQAALLANVAQIAIVVLAFAMGMEQMGFGEEIITLAFGVTLAAVGIAAAIAFGMGGREVAAEIVADWRARVTTKKKSGRS